MLSVVDKPATLKEGAPKIHEGRMTFNGKEARHVLDNMNYDRQRNIEQAHVSSLAAMMRARIFLPVTQVAFGRFDGKLYLVNGQHRFSAIAQCDLPQEFQVLIHDCKTEEELRELYRRFDAVMKVRSLEQLLDAADIAVVNGVSRMVAKATYVSAGFIINGMRTPTATSGNPAERRVIDFRLETCRALWPAARDYQIAVDKARGRLKARLLNGGITAVALTTYRHQPERAKIFWESVAANDGLKKGDPRQALVNVLLTADAKLASDNLMGSAAVAWNAFFGGRNLSFLRPSMPILLKGTPLASKKEEGEG